jgi:hypothetical protein
MMMGLDVTGLEVDARRPRGPDAPPVTVTPSRARPLPPKEVVPHKLAGSALAGLSVAGSAPGGGGNTDSPGHAAAPSPMPHLSAGPPPNSPAPKAFSPMPPLPGVAYDDGSPRGSGHLPPVLSCHLDRSRRLPPPPPGLVAAISPSSWR